MYYRKTTVWNTVAPLREGPPGVKSWVSKIFSLLLRLKIAFGQGPLSWQPPTFQLSRAKFYPKTKQLFTLLSFHPNQYHKGVTTEGFQSFCLLLSQSTVSDKYKELIVLKVTEGILCDEILRWASVGGLRQVPRFCCKKLKQNRGTW